jgi:hypothetical protein
MSPKTDTLNPFREFPTETRNPPSAVIMRKVGDCQTLLE